MERSVLNRSSEHTDKYLYSGLMTQQLIHQAPPLFFQPFVFTFVQLSIIGEK